ncbi:MAG: hypothetical protein WBL50_05005 [Candidatus Acidiferrum sp.]
MASPKSTKTIGLRLFRTSPLIAIVTVLVLGQNKNLKEPFTIAIKVETPSVKVESAVVVNGRLTNTSNRPIDASGRYCGPSGLDSYLTWDVRNLEGQSVAKKIYPHPELATGSAILDRIIKPGESLAGDQDISRLYDMSRPGEYVIQASRPTSDAKDAQVIKSNKVSVTVIP